MKPAPIATSQSIPSLPDGWEVERYSILPGGQLAIIGIEGDPNGTSRITRKTKARVWILIDEELYVALEFPLRHSFPMVDQFTDGHWLVVHACSPREGGNARVLTADGAEVRRFELGDAIRHVKIDNQNRIWVGWFDQGVFSNDNWHVPGLRRPPSCHGIAAFDDRGHLLKHANLASIVECYALNVFRSEAWACPYVDFPVWRLTEESERTWPTNLRGVMAIAVSEPFVLVAGGYEGDRNRVVLLELGDANAEIIGEWRLPIGNPYHLFDARSDELHIVLDGVWYRWSVRDFLSDIT